MSGRRLLRLALLGPLLAAGGAAPARAAGGRAGVPLPRGTWWGDEAAEAAEAAEASSSAQLPAFAALVAGAAPGGRGDAGPPATVALHPAVARGALPRPLVNTQESFSAAAWVRLDDRGAHRAVAVAQGGEHASAFALGYVAGNFAMTTTHEDRAGAAERHCWAAAPPAEGEWAHLVGVFDARGGQLRLYVDGALAASAPAPKMWAASRATTVGRGQLADGWSDPWPGDIEDVRIFATALTDANVQALHLDQPAM